MSQNATNQQKLKNIIPRLVFLSVCLFLNTISNCLFLPSFPFLMLCDKIAVVVLEGELGFGDPVCGVAADLNRLTHSCHLATG